MQLVALTGGIASGKSTVRERFQELGAVTIDADQLARDAVAPGTPGLKALVGAFGSAILTPEGALDRPALGNRVFGNPALLTQLNDIVHPEVRRLATEVIGDARRARPDAVIVYEIPLLAETGARGIDGVGDWDLVITTHADVQTRLERLITLRGMSDDEARRRLASQATDAERFAIADVSINTSGALSETQAQVDAIWERLTNA